MAEAGRAAALDLGQDQGHGGSLGHGAAGGTLDGRALQAYFPTEMLFHSVEQHSRGLPQLEGEVRPPHAALRQTGWRPRRVAAPDARQLYAGCPCPPAWPSARSLAP